MRHGSAALFRDKLPGDAAAAIRLVLDTGQRALKLLDKLQLAVCQTLYLSLLSIVYTRFGSVRDGSHLVRLAFVFCRTNQFAILLPGFLQLGVDEDA